MLSQTREAYSPEKLKHFSPMVYTGFEARIPMDATKQTELPWEEHFAPAL